MRAVAEAMTKAALPSKFGLIQLIEPLFDPDQHPTVRDVIAELPAIQTRTALHHSVKPQGCRVPPEFRFVPPCRYVTAPRHHGQDYAQGVDSFYVDGD